MIPIIGPRAKHRPGQIATGWNRRVRVLCWRRVGAKTGPTKDSVNVRREPRRKPKVMPPCYHTRRASEPNPLTLHEG